ncbi:MAG TPA: invasion associated locus B family protein [Ferrovibrio sp.]|uniref:invasion associated locus B family protein n=1 Tax=Ferrovibrio sp. TaxID=1917215 RepID=UPI002ED2ED4E
MAHRPAALLLASLLLFLGSSAAGLAAASKKTESQSETRQIGSFQSWSAYEYTTEKGAKLCYLYSVPEKKLPVGAKRGEIYILVTHKPKEKIRNEVSIYFGYPLKENVSAQAIVGNTTIDMFTHEEAAWAADSATDQKLVELFRKGSTLVVKGESTRGTKTTDTYDLNGFTAALHAIDKACHVGGATS